MFKIGEEVVFTGKDIRNNDMILPTVGSDVTIESYGPICSCGCGQQTYVIYGYRDSKFGGIQWFAQNNFERKIDFDFGKQVADEIEELINEEELVPIN